MALGLDDAARYAAPMSQDPRDLKDPTTHAWFALGGLVVTILLVIAQLYAPAGIMFLATLVWAVTAAVRARKVLRYAKGRPGFDEA